MTFKKLLLTLPVLLAPVVLAGQGRGLAPADLLKPLADSWPTYNGDYSGKRYSALTQINQKNVMNLTLAWTAKLTAGSASTNGFGGFGGGRGGGGGTPLIIGGEGTGEFDTGGGVTVKASALMVDGTLYLTSPDNAWALDARDGRELWHYFWKTRGGTHIATRGFGMTGNYLYMETPDNYLVSLDAKTGKERWHKVISDFNQQYFSTMAPIVVDNHVIAGTGNDLDMPGFLQSFDTETGALQWKLYTVPMNQGDPGLDTWPSLDAARHGGAQPWLPGAFDPETRLYIFGTGNPTPAYTLGRGEGDNLFTGSLVAVNVDTGKMAWYYQTAPHDMHDWDSAQTPVLVDARINGRMRKLAMTAARNGYFFVVDRVTGEHILTSKYGSATNWVKEIDAQGRPRRNPEKDPSVGGSIVSPSAGGTVNWEPPAFSPDTGLFYVAEDNTYSIFYLLDTDPRGSMGLGGKLEARAGSGGSFLTAIDYKTGKAAWRHKYEGGAGGGGGVLATAGKLVFAGDGGGSIVAHDALTGKPLWHSRVGDVTNPPQTYMLDCRQYLLVASGDTMFAFVMYAGGSPAAP
jgi:alcohol dehydrogenase (cytochrome c)